MKYPKSFIKQLRRFSAFLVIFVPYFQTAGNAADAPWEDLSFRRRLEEFRQIDSEVAAAVLNTWNRHVEFLSPEFAFLSLFSKKVPVSKKTKLRRSFLRLPSLRIFSMKIRLGLLMLTLAKSPILSVTTTLLMTWRKTGCSNGNRLPGADHKGSNCSQPSKSRGASVVTWEGKFCNQIRWKRLKIGARVTKWIYGGIDSHTLLIESFWNETNHITQSITDPNRTKDLPSSGVDRDRQGK